MDNKVFKALVLGGTGEVGKEVVRQLVAHPAFTSVTVVGRRPFEGLQSDKLISKQIDFDNLSDHTEAFSDAQVRKKHS